MSTGAASQLHPALVEPGPSTLVAAAAADRNRIAPTKGGNAPDPGIAPRPKGWDRGH
jgi:hypothetical protein